MSDLLSENAVIKVIGVGGGGSNALEHMLPQNIEGVDFICVNTDSQALKNSNANNIIQIGNELTKGLGAGSDPDVGKRAAQESRSDIQKSLEGADMIFITAGMGGGTGTGAAPLIAEIAKEMSVLTVAVVTKPFIFEGRRRMQLAEYGIEELSKIVDSLIIIPNENLLNVLGKNTSLLDAFKSVNHILQGAVQGIAELITRPGLINVDFADVKTVMSTMGGTAMMGTASAFGENRARKAAESAVASPLLEDINLSDAKGVLVNITSGIDISIGEFEEVGDVIKEFTSDQATVVVGTVIDPNMSDELRATIVVTGLERIRENGGNDKSANINKKQSNSFYNSNYIKNTALKNKLSYISNRSLLKKSNNNDLKSDRKKESFLDIPSFLRRKSD